MSTKNMKLGKMTNNKGKFIVFEGLDGSGTTTQARLLKDWLEKEGQPVHLTHEPSEGPIGLLIRLALSGRLVSPIRNRVQKLDEHTLALFFAADRMDHIQTTIRPKLEQGINVISDRYYLSSFAYQSLTVDLEWLKQINSKCPSPDVTFFLDVPVLVCKKRMAKERWHIELYEDIDKLDKIRDTYINLIQTRRLTANETIIRVEGNLPIKDIHNQIKRLASKLLKNGFLRVPPVQQMLINSDGIR